MPSDGNIWEGKDEKEIGISPDLSDQVAGLGGHPVGVFTLPLDVAPDRVGEGDAHGLPRGVLLQCPLEVVHRRLRGLAGVVHSPARVDELALLIEDIEVGSPRGSIGQGDLLGLVPEVEPGEPVLLHPIHHVLETVRGHRVGAVGVDPYEPHLLGGEPFDGLPGRLVRAYDEGAVVAREEDDEGLVVEVVERVGFAVGCARARP